MRWKNRCPARIYAKIDIPSYAPESARVQAIDQCYWESGHEGQHWSKQFGEREPWIILDDVSGYNPYTSSAYWDYLQWIQWILESPKEKPNVGYWPRGTSSSNDSEPLPLHWILLTATNRRSEQDILLELREREENYAYHRHQQHITDEFRGKLHFANRIVTP